MCQLRKSIVYQWLEPMGDGYPQSSPKHVLFLYNLCLFKQLRIPNTCARCRQVLACPCCGMWSNKQTTYSNYLWLVTCGLFQDWHNLCQSSRCSMQLNSVSGRNQLPATKSVPLSSRYASTGCGKSIFRGVQLIDESAMQHVASSSLCISWQKELQAIKFKKK